MFLKISDMPKDAKLYKILPANKIKQHSTRVEFQKDKNDKFIISEKMKFVVWSMVKTCLAADGLGLHAAQIGVFKSLFIIRKDPESFQAYFNGSFVEEDDSVLVESKEGCLSIPGKTFTVPRHSKILAQWLEFNDDLDLMLKEKLLEGLDAVVWQHEYDHGIGKTLYDYQK